MLMIVQILVHGSKGQGVRLRSKLLGLRKEGQPLHNRLLDVHHPRNTEPVTIGFRTDKIAKVVGKLAEEYMPLSLRPKVDGTVDQDDSDEEANIKKGKMLEEPRGISGVLVQNEFKLSLMAPSDLKEFAGLTTTTLICREKLTLRAAGISLIRWALQSAFGEVVDITTAADETIGGENSASVLEVMGCVRVAHLGASGEVEVEWEGGVLVDGVADAVLGVLLGVERSPAAVARSSKAHSHGYEHGHTNGSANGDRAKVKRRSLDPKERLSRLFLLLEAQFGSNAITPIEIPPPSASTNPDEDDETAQEKEMQKVLERLHTIGIPVPGIEIQLTEEGTSAKVWLEDLRVECANGIWKNRVEAVVREAVDGVSPLWG
jgi:cleavage and polyadenylation specificity factor subunit 3